MKIKKIILACILMISAINLSAQEGVIGEIRLFAGNFAPRGWAFCSGQILAINTNQALFSILGTTYGGNGIQTFALPDLRGRVVVQQGQGPGLSNYALGEVVGTEGVTIQTSNLPAHNHTVTFSQAASTHEGTSTSPEGRIPAVSGTNAYSSPESGTTALANTTIQTSVVGGSIPIENRQPTLVINYIICIDGIFPSRN